VLWHSTGWTDNRNVTQLLEFMVLRGEVAIAGRRGGDRPWDLATRVYPDDPVVPRDEALRIRNQRRLRALGIARARGPECPVEPVDVGEAGEPAVVEGVKGTWRVDPSQLGQPFSGRAALLSPFDRLIHHRKRTVELFARAALTEQGHRRHDLAGRAETALQRVAPDERGLQGVERSVGRQPLDGFHLPRVARRRQRQARQHAFAVHRHGAGPARALIAPFFVPVSPRWSRSASSSVTRVSSSSSR